ncbi:hypothetical protein DFS34DRAFT_649175 [Phlyctochytrium arcticum]|nr:hypothetical protein DFS34DRAFT_649175 [Phlyctochytrium arcticum]
MTIQAARYEPPQATIQQRFNIQLGRVKDTLHGLLHSHRAILKVSDRGVPGAMPPLLKICNLSRKSRHNGGVAFMKLLEHIRRYHGRDLTVTAAGGILSTASQRVKELGLDMSHLPTDYNEEESDSEEINDDEENYSD